MRMKIFIKFTMARKKIGSKVWKNMSISLYFLKWLINVYIKDRR